MKKLVYFLALLLLLSANKGYSQDPYLIIPNQVLVNLNPSFAGSNGFIRNQAYFQNQNVSYVGSPKTFINTFDVFIEPISSGIAVSGLYNSYGPVTQSKFSLAYAQYFSFFSDKRLKVVPSLQLGYGLNKFDSDWYFLPPQHIAYRKEYIDLGTGLLINFKNFYAGASVFHLNRPDIGVYGRQLLFIRNTYHASYNVHIGNYTLLNFSTFYTGNRVANDWGVAVDGVFLKYVIAGGSYSIDNSPTLNIGFRNNFFNVRFGYAFHYNGYLNSKYNLSAALNLRTKEKRKELVNFEAW